MLLVERGILGFSGIRTKAREIRNITLGHTKQYSSNKMMNRFRRLEQYQ